VADDEPTIAASALAAAKAFSKPSDGKTPAGSFRDTVELEELVVAAAMAVRAHGVVLEIGECSQHDAGRCFAGWLSVHWGLVG